MDKKIIVIGSLNMDMRLELNSLPKRGETILCNNVIYTPGGKGANQACTIGKLGGDITMLGCVGCDEYAEKLIKSLDDCNVQHKNLKFSKTNSTGSALICVDKNADNSIIVHPGANHDCDIEYIAKHEHLISECDYILLQMEIPFDTLKYIIQKYKNSKTIILNPAPAISNISEEILENIDYLTPNETELFTITSQFKTKNTDDIETNAKLLYQKGVKNVIVTLGSKGCILYNKNGLKHFKANEVEPLDTTAAGDCFNGTIAFALAKGLNIEKSIELANIASSITVTRKGAQSSLPSYDEVISRYK